ncbi:hypothetical protein PIB30_100045, partial [Stylosanthes scabra]|nr:hypothetical protein [Stylosanthes scabra]
EWRKEAKKLEKLEEKESRKKNKLTQESPSHVWTTPRRGSKRDPSTQAQSHGSSSQSNV